MALQNFADKVTSITHTWLNKIDVLYVTVFGEATTKAEARTAITSDAPFTIAQGGTNSTTAAAALVALNAASLAGNNFTSTQIITNTLPKLVIIESGVTANNGRWQLYAEGENLYLGAVNDADTAQSLFLVVQRTGTTVDAVTLEATTVTVTGTLTGSSITLSSTQPLIEFVDTNATADNKRWHLFSDAEAFELRAINDAGTGGTAAFAVQRTGNVIDSVDFGGDIKLLTAKRIDLQNSQGTVGAAGGASALPATPTGYIPIKVAGTEFVIPYYAKT